MGPGGPSVPACLSENRPANNIDAKLIQVDFRHASAPNPPANQINDWVSDKGEGQDHRPHPAGFAGMA